MEIFVGRLPSEMSAEQLQALFQPYGRVASARVVIDKFSGLSRGFGFVEMPDAEEAASAIRAVDGREVGGSRLQVQVSRTSSRRRGS